MRCCCAALLPCRSRKLDAIKQHDSATSPAADIELRCETIPHLVTGIELIA